MAGCTKAPVEVTRRPLPSMCSDPSRVSACVPSARPHAQEALALDGHVERLVRALQRALGERAPGVHRGGAGARLGALGRGAAGLRVDEVAEADALVLVARRVRVGQVVGDGVDASLLGGHARGGGVESLEHSLVRIGRDAPNLERAGAALDAVRPARPGAVSTSRAAVQENSPLPRPSPESGSKYSCMPPPATSRSVVASSAPACASSPCARSPRASSQLRFDPDRPAPVAAAVELRAEQVGRRDAQARPACGSAASPSSAATAAATSPGRSGSSSGASESTVRGAERRPARHLAREEAPLARVPQPAQQRRVQARPPPRASGPGPRRGGRRSPTMACVDHSQIALNSGSSTRTGSAPRASSSA